MSVAWMIPPVILLGGLGLVLALLRSVAAASADLQRDLHELGEVSMSVATVRAGAARARASFEDVRQR